jgi:hypothetical protein
MRPIKKETQAVKDYIDHCNLFLSVLSHNDNVSQAEKVAVEMAECINGIVFRQNKHVAVDEIAQGAISFAENKDDIAAQTCLNVIQHFINDPDMQKKSGGLEQNIALQNFIKVRQIVKDMTLELDQVSHQKQTMNVLK